MSLFSNTEQVLRRYGRYVDDCRKLCEFHSVRTGSPSDFLEVGPKLASSEGFRLDLSDLARTARDKESARLSAADMLSIVGVAIGGPAIVTAEEELSGSAGTLQILLAGVGGWSDRVDPQDVFGGSDQQDTDLPDDAYSAEDYEMRNASGRVAEQFRPRVTDSRRHRDAAREGHSSADVKDTLARLELASLQLKVYLDDIDRRMGRIEPHLEDITAIVHSSAEYHQRPAIRMDETVGDPQPLEASDPRPPSRHLRSEEAISAAMDRASNERFTAASAFADGPHGVEAHIEQPVTAWAWQEPFPSTEPNPTEEAVDLPGDEIVDGGLEVVKGGEATVTTTELASPDLHERIDDLVPLARMVPDTFTTKTPVQLPVVAGASAVKRRSAVVWGGGVVAAALVVAALLLYGPKRLVNGGDTVVQGAKSAGSGVENRGEALVASTTPVPVPAVSERETGATIATQSDRTPRVVSKRRGSAAVQGSAGASSTGAGQGDGLAVAAPVSRSAPSQGNSSAAPVDPRSQGEPIKNRVEASRAEDTPHPPRIEVLPAEGAAQRGALSSGASAHVESAALVTRASAEPPAGVAGTARGAGDIPHASAAGAPLPTDTTGGNVLSAPAPIYPQDARRLAIQGKVILQATISKSGDVKALRVVSGPVALLQSAQDAVRRRRYQPFLLHGEPSEFQTVVTINYRLSE